MSYSDIVIGPGALGTVDRMVLGAAERVGRSVHRVHRSIASHFKSPEPTHLKPPDERSEVEKTVLPVVDKLDILTHAAVTAIDLPKQTLDQIKQQREELLDHFGHAGAVTLASVDFGVVKYHWYPNYADGKIEAKALKLETEFDTLVALLDSHEARKQVEQQLRVWAERQYSVMRMELYDRLINAVDEHFRKDWSTFDHKTWNWGLTPKPIKEAVELHAELRAFIRKFEALEKRIEKHKDEYVWDGMRHVWYTRTRWEESKGGQIISADSLGATARAHSALLSPIVSQRMMNIYNI